MVVVLLVGIPMQSYSFILLKQNKNGNIFAYFVKFYWNMLICPRLLFFFRGERKFTATPCRNFSLAVRLEGCKDFFELVYDFQRYSQRVLFSSFFAIAIANANF